MNRSTITLLLFFAATCFSFGQSAEDPVTTFRVLYIDQPFTEEEARAISDGTIPAAVEAHFPSGAEGKDAMTKFSLLRNQISQAQTYRGRGPILLSLATSAKPAAASIPVPKEGGDLLAILKPRQPGVLEGAASIVIGSTEKEFPPGNLCIVNVTDFRLAFQMAEGNTIVIQPDEQRVFAPKRQRMDSVPLRIVADVKPTPRVVYEGAVRLSDKDRIMFIAYSPPGSTDVFKTDFFMLQPPIGPSSP